MHYRCPHKIPSTERTMYLTNSAVLVHAVTPQRSVTQLWSMRARPGSDAGHQEVRCKMVELLVALLMMRTWLTRRLIHEPSSSLGLMRKPIGRLRV